MILISIERYPVGPDGKPAPKGKDGEPVDEEGNKIPVDKDGKVKPGRHTGFHIIFVDKRGRPCDKFGKRLPKAPNGNPLDPTGKEIPVWADGRPMPYFPTVS